MPTSEVPPEAKKSSVAPYFSSFRISAYAVAIFRSVSFAGSTYSAFAAASPDGDGSSLRLILPFGVSGSGSIRTK